MRVALLGLAFAILIAGCASTQLVDVWQDPSYVGRPLKKVLVLAVLNEERSRRIFEESFARELRAAGIEAVVGYSVLSDTSALEREVISNAIEGKGFDGVVITRHGGSEEETVFYPGRVRTEAWGTGDRGGRGYDNYYRRTYETVTEPGYSAKYTTVFIETNVYATESGNLIWSGRSATYNPDSTVQIVDAVSKEVVASMKQGGLL